jgi:hypothetical protein
MTVSDTINQAVPISGDDENSGVRELEASGLETWAIATIAAVGAACATVGLIITIIVIRSRRRRTKEEDADEEDAADATAMASARESAISSSDYGSVPPIVESGGVYGGVYGGVPTVSKVAELSDLPSVVDGSGNYGSSSAVEYGDLELSTHTQRHF